MADSEQPEKPAGMALIKRWVEQYEVKADALRELNKKLGTKYEHGHLSRWERGEREPNAAARKEMMRKVLCARLEGVLSRQKIISLLDDLT